MYNSGGAVEATEMKVKVKVKARGSGRFGAYSSRRPKRCVLDMKEDEFTYNDEDKLLTIKLEGGKGNFRDILFVYCGWSYGVT